MKIIFLDIDDVLNNPISGYGGHIPTDNGGISAFTKETIKWDVLAVARLKRIIEATDAKIVISSTWRGMFNMIEWGWIFELYGLDPDLIKGRTGNEFMPGGKMFRGLAIQEWFRTFPDRRNECTGYVILDDGSDFYNWQNLVQTEVYVGLIECHVQEAIDALNGDKQNMLGIDAGDKEIENRFPKWEKLHVGYDEEYILRQQGRLPKE